MRYGDIYTRYGSTVNEMRAFVSAETAARATAISPGDIVFAGTGETREEVGKAVTWVGTGQAVAGGDTVILRGHGQDPRFLAHALNADDALRQKMRLCTGNAIVHLHAADIGRLRVWIPPLRDQRFVADALDTWDKAKEGVADLYWATARQRLGILQRMLG